MPGAPDTATTLEVDVAVVGAGFSGLYLLHRLRQPIFSPGHPVAG